MIYGAGDIESALNIEGHLTGYDKRSPVRVGFRSSILTVSVPSWLKRPLPVLEL